MKTEFNVPSMYLIVISKKTSCHGSTTQNTLQVRDVSTDQSKNAISMFMWIKNILFTYELKSASWLQGGNTSHNFHCAGRLHLSSEIQIKLKYCLISINSDSVHIRVPIESGSITKSESGFSGIER
jgi:hypothetical protein